MTWPMRRSISTSDSVRRIGLSGKTKPNHSVPTHHPGPRVPNWLPDLSTLHSCVISLHESLGNHVQGRLTSTFGLAGSLVSLRGRNSVFRGRLLSDDIGDVLRK